MTLESSTYFACVFHFDLLFSISSSLQKKKWLAINLGLKGFNCAKQKIEDQIENFKRSLFQFTEWIVNKCTV